MTATAIQSVKTADSETAKGLGMGAKMPRGGVPLHLRPVVSRRIRSVAVRGGWSEALAQKKMYGEHSAATDTAHVIEGLIDAGDTEGAAFQLAIVEAAIYGAAVPHIVECLLEAALSDADEDMAEARYRAHPSADTAKPYIRKLAHEMVKAGALVAALKREYEL